MRHIPSFEEFVNESRFVEIDIESVLESIDIDEAINEMTDDAIGLLSAALAAGGMGATLIAAFIANVKKDKKANPSKSWKDCVKDVYDSTAKGAHTIRKHIG